MWLLQQVTKLKNTGNNNMIRDFPTCYPYCENNMFADDTVIFTQAKTSIEAKNSRQTYINKIDEWAYKWKLSFSVEKSVIMVFSKKRHRESDPILTLKQLPIAVKN